MLFIQHYHTVVVVLQLLLLLHRELSLMLCLRLPLLLAVVHQTQQQHLFTNHHQHQHHHHHRGTALSFLPLRPLKESLSWLWSINQRALFVCWDMLQLEYPDQPSSKITFNVETLPLLLLLLQLLPLPQQWSIHPRHHLVHTEKDVNFFHPLISLVVVLD